jgi:hypothetical protein
MEGAGKDDHQEESLKISIAYNRLQEISERSVRILESFDLDLPLTETDFRNSFLQNIAAEYDHGEFFLTGRLPANFDCRQLVTCDSDCLVSG